MLERRVFKLVPLMGKTPNRIECICTASGGYQLYVSYQNGRICVYELGQEEARNEFNYGEKSLVIGNSGDIGIVVSDIHGHSISPSACTRDNLLKIHYEKVVSKRSILKIACLKELGILIVLTGDGLIQFHNIISSTDSASIGSDALEMVTAITNCKGTSDLAVVTFVDVEGSIPTLSARLALVNRKRIVFYEWKETEFSYLKEVCVPDRVKALEWSPDGKSIFVASGREYFQINMSSSEPKSIFSFGRTTLNPIIAPMDDGVMLLLKDKLGISVSCKDGLPLVDKQPFNFNLNPEVIVYEFPFVIAVGNHVVHVFSRESRHCIQKIDISGCCRIARSYRNSLIVTNENQIYHLSSVGILDQVDELVVLKEFEEALAILTDHNKVSASRKEEKICKIKSKYAFYRFEREEYDQAMMLFFECHIDPILVIGLFPGLLTYDLRDSLNYPDDISSFENREPTNTDKAYVSLIGYLTSVRTRMHSLARRNSFSQQANFKSRYVPDLLTMVDTTLLKIYLRSNPSMVGPLVRVTNDCDPDETVLLLRKYERFTELIDFFRGKERHGEALTMLLTEFDQVESLRDSVNERLVEYLSYMGSKEMNILLEYAPLILKRSFEIGKSIFIRDMDVEDLQPYQPVIDYLEGSIYGKELLLSYLEYLIMDRGVKESTIHLKYVKCLIEEVVVEGKDKTTLSNFLGLSSCFYSAVDVLELLPAEGEGFDEERCFLLGRLGRHEHALSILVESMGNLDLAEDYCRQYYDVRSAPLVYSYLLNLYLEKWKKSGSNDSGGKGGKNGSGGVVTRLTTVAKQVSSSKPVKNIDTNKAGIFVRMIKLLEDHAKKLNFSRVLNALPAEVPICKLEKFLSSSFMHGRQDRMQSQLVKGLGKSQVTRCRSLKQTQSRTSILVSDNTLCSKCFKRMGTSAFVVSPGFPDPKISHFSCN